MSCNLPVDPNIIILDFSSFISCFLAYKMSLPEALAEVSFVGGVVCGGEGVGVGLNPTPNAEMFPENYKNKCFENP